MKVTITIEAEVIPIEPPMQLEGMTYPSLYPSLGEVLSEFEGLLEHDAGIKTFERMRVLTASIT